MLQRFTRRRQMAVGFGLMALGAIAVAAAVPVSAGPRVASQTPTPVVVPGNPTCASINPAWTELKVEPVTSGMKTDGTMSVNMTVSGLTVSWSSNLGVDAVLVKGGPNANLYTYIPEATSDSGMHAPVNPTNGQYYGLSHVSYCYDVECCTTTTICCTTTSSTTTTAPTTTSSSTTTSTSSSTSTTTSTSTSTSSTTAPTSTTTSSTTTTPSSTTTSTTTPSSTTTAPSTTSTTQPTTTTAGHGTTTTSAAPGPSTTAPRPPSPPARRLPATGSNAAPLLVLGTFLLAIGLFLVAGATRLRRS